MDPRDLITKRVSSKDDVKKLLGVLGSTAALGYGAYRGLKRLIRGKKKKARLGMGGPRVGLGAEEMEGMDSDANARKLRGKQTEQGDAYDDTTYDAEGREDHCGLGRQSLKGGKTKRRK